MNNISRRRFIGQSFVGAGALAAGAAWAVESNKEEKKHGSRSVTDRVELQNTGIYVSRLAMGTGMRGYNRSSDQTRQGQKKYTEMIRHGFDNGLNFIDMADLYGSHPFTKNAMEGISRDKYVILTKIWLRKSGDWMIPSGGAKEEVERYCKELGTEMIDVCLLHCLSNADWPDRYKRVLDELSELKEKGIVRAAGVSCHNHEALKTAVDLDWTDVVFARINHDGTKMDGPVEEITPTLQKARANGKAIIGMKIYGEGTFTEPEQKDASIKYVVDNNLVDSMTIGMMNPAQIDENMGRIDKALNA